MKHFYKTPLWVLIAGLLVTLVSSLCYVVFGSDAQRNITYLGAMLQALSGISCSLIASSTYVMFEQQMQRNERRHTTDVFLRTFAVPGLTAIPRCFIVAAQRQELTGTTETGERFVCKFPLALHWANDIDCANALQGLVVGAGGEFPELITPDVARSIRGDINGPAILFSVGLHSNPFSTEVCADAIGDVHNLIRLPMDDRNGCSILTAAATGDSYNVTTNAGRPTFVPPSPETTDAIVLRTRDPKKREIAYVVVGGHYGQGTSMLGCYLRRHWRDFAERCDSTSPKKSLADRNYLAQLTMLKNGLAAGQLFVAGKLVEKA